MENKVLLILVDGMRPDSLAKCGHPLVKELLEKGSYTLSARTVMPSVTLPCHMSLFHSVTPDRHNVLTNTYTPQVRPIAGLFEQLAKFEKKNAMFYDWEELRDVSRPGSLAFSFLAGARDADGMHRTLVKTTKAICEYIPEEKPDFTFFYIGVPDEVGHKYGWMTEEYLASVAEAWDSIAKVLAVLPEEYQVIVTADHGGHNRQHGTDLPEDMTIPMFFIGKELEAAKEAEQISIMDIAPTVTKLLGIPANRDWEGKPLL